MPVGNGDDAAGRDLTANVLFRADRPLHEPENLVPVGIGDEQFLEYRQVRNREIALAVSFLPHEGVKQPIVNDEAGGNDEEVFGVTVAIRRAVRVENLPDHEGLQNPGLSRSGRHFQAVFRIGVFWRADNLGIPCAGQHHVRSGNLVEVLQGRNAQNLMGIDHVQQGLPLAGMEIEGAGVLKFSLEPPLQKLGRDLRDVIEDRRFAGFQTGAGFLDLGRQSFGKRKIIDACHHATSTVASASKPNTSTTRTQTRRGPFFWGMLVILAVVMTR